MRSFMEIAKALAEENRIRILCLLQKQELCVCQVIEVLGLAPSTVSKHLSILYQARLIDCIKKGRWVYYNLPCEDVSKEVSAAFQWVFVSLAKDKQIQEDAKRLEDILKLNPEELCKLQAAK